MKKLILSYFIIGLALQVNAQTIELPQTLISVNYKYLNTIDADNTPKLVKKLTANI